jgi:hypothetical protein
VREWTLEVASMPGLAHDTRPLEAMHEALSTDARLHSPAASVDVQTGVLSATFRVEARTQGQACHTGIDAFYNALRQAGYDVDRPGWRLHLTVNPESPVDDF